MSSVTGGRRRQTINEGLSHLHLLQQRRRRIHRRHPDLAYCSALGKTPAEVLTQVQLAKKAWFAAAKSAGKRTHKPRYRPAIYQIAS
jgi:hypothetical protein